MRKSFRIALIVSSKLAFAALLCSLAMYPVWAQQQDGTAIIIKNIEVQGAARIEPGTVKSYLLIREGDTFDLQRIDRSLKSLFATGLFADVNILQEGSNLIIKIVENPVINRVAFEGNKAVETESLQSEISLRARVIYTRAKVQNDVKRLLTLYRLQGRFAVTVEPKVIKLPQNRVDLVYEIVEGDETEILSVRFVGNKKYNDRELRGIVETKETTWYRIFSSNSVYDPDRLTLDRELLRRFYLSQGYADFKVNSAIAELTPNRKDFFITYTVEEGSRYKLGNVEVKAQLRDLTVDQIAHVVKLKKDDWYDITSVDKSVDAITDRVGELGYAFVDVRPRVKRNREKNQIDIIFEVNEGPRVFVERIDISGNVRTLDKVIRREFQIVEGDAFNSAKIRRSRQRLQNLNFFKRVNVGKIPGSAPDKTIVTVDVQEQSTGSISLGAGFSSSVGVIGEIGLQEKNFLGRGQNVGLKLNISGARSQIDFGLTEPYFLNRDIRAGFDVFHVRQDLQDTSSIDTSRSGFSLRAGYRLSEDTSQGWRYTIRRSKIQDVADDAADLIKTEIGTEYISEIGHTIDLKTMDNHLTPTNGYSIRLRTDIAGLGGTVRHSRNTLSGAYYYPVTDNWIVHTRGKVGYIFGLGKDVHFQERYFVGGEDLRGFATAGVGPRDDPTNDALGAEWMYVGSVALKFPLGLPSEFGLRGRVFTDFGSAGKIEPTDANTQDSQSPRLSTGLGMTWRSPFGPLGIDAAIPLVKKDFDITETFRINFGAQF